MTTVSIHQPTFLPWTGFFEKMLHSDVMVILDTVRVSRKTWVTRNRVQQLGSEIWLRVPSNRSRTSLIHEIGVAAEFREGARILATLKHLYSSREAFQPVYTNLYSIFARGHEKVADLNLSLINYFRSQLGLSTEIIRASEIFAGEQWLDQESGNSLLLHIAKRIGATSYVSGMGCLDFISPASWEESGIRFRFLKMKNQEYPQPRNVGSGSRFVENLSIVDPMMEIGPTGVSSLLGKGELISPSAVQSVLTTARNL